MKHTKATRLPHPPGIILIAACAIVLTACGGKSPDPLAAPDALVAPEKVADAQTDPQATPVQRQRRPGAATPPGTPATPGTPAPGSPASPPTVPEAPPAAPVVPAGSGADPAPLYPGLVQPKALPALSLPMPGYLETLPNPNTGTLVTRITDPAAFGVPNTRVLRHTYAKSQPWNADASLLFLGFSYPGYLLDGRSFRYLRRIDQPSDAVWSNTDPNLMYGTPIDTSRFVKHDVRTNQSTVVRTFQQYTALRLGSGEGNLSNDDRRVALFGRNAQGNVDAFVYDLVSDAVTGTLSLPMNWSQVQTIASTLSQSGAYVVIEYASRGTGPMQGKKVYDVQMNLLRTVSAGSGHADFGYDASGHEVMVTADDPAGSNDRSFWAIRLSDAVRTKVLDGSAIGWQTHVSCRATRRPGYCYVSTFFANPVSDYDWAPLYNQGFAIRLDGSLGIEPFAQLMHGANTDYPRQPHLVPNRDGSLILWASDWNDAAPDAAIHTYVAGRTLPQ